MIGQYAFDPASGAPLSEERFHYPDTSRPPRDCKHGFPSRNGRMFRQGARIPEYHPDVVWTAVREGALTNGELCSSSKGLLGFFKRKHREVSEPNPALERKAALSIKRLKAVTDPSLPPEDRLPPGCNLDCYLWYALAEQLASKDHWTAWMFECAIPRCPHPTSDGTVCGSAPKFRPATSVVKGGTFLEAVCASEPTRHGAVDDKIRDFVGTIYEAAFDEAFDPVFL